MENNTVERERRAPVLVEILSLAHVEEKEVDDLEEQQRVSNDMCDAVDLIVESRSAAVAAIRDSHKASLTAQLQLMVSQFPVHIRKLPMKRFLKQHCPNTVHDTRSDGTLCFEFVHDPIGRLQTPGVLLPFSSSSLAFGSRRQSQYRRSGASTV